MAGTDLDIESYSTLNARASGESKNSLFQDFKEDEVKMARPVKHQKKLLANVLDLNKGGYSSVTEMKPRKLYYFERGGKLHRKGKVSRSPRRKIVHHRTKKPANTEDDNEAAILDEIKHLKMQMKEEEMLEIENRI